MTNAINNKTREYRYIRVAVIGQPNSGKSSLINRLTGSNLKIGNFAGVTIGESEVSYAYKDCIISFVDLPGLYSLDPTSEDEKLSYNFLKNTANYDLILNVVDSSQLSKSLQLTLTIKDTISNNIIVAANMIDLLKQQNLMLDSEVLSHELGLSVVSLSALNGKNTIYCLNEIINFIASKPAKMHNFTSQGEKNSAIYQLTTKVIVSNNSNNIKGSFTDLADKILLNRYLTLPIFFSAMFGIFGFTFTAGEYPGKLIEQGGRLLSEIVKNLIGNNIFSVMLGDGVITSVALVLSFLPKILTLFLCIALLEQSGYMARVVFISNGLLQRCGLNGKAAIALISGFGCTIPAYMATRILHTPRERLLSMIAIGFIPCSAKMTLFILLVDTFFPAHPTIAMIMVYMSSIFLALAVSFTLSKTLLKDKIPPSLILELPEYRLPQWSNILRELQLKSTSYIKNAALSIAVFSLILWFFAHIPLNPLNKQYWNYIAQIESVKNDSERSDMEKYLLSNSLLGNAGKFISPIFSPLGFDWKMTISFLSAIGAKEVAISAFNVMYGSGETNETSLKYILNKQISLPAAISYLVFMIIYVPCTSAMSVFAKEVKKGRYTIAVITSITLMAWIMAYLSFNISGLLLL